MARLAKVAAAALAILFAVAACGSFNPGNLIKGKNERLQIWIGENGEYLERRWAPPDRVNALPSGGRELTYRYGGSNDSPDCLVLFRITPFNLVEAAELVIDEGGCREILVYPET